MKKVLFVYLLFYYSHKHSTSNWQPHACSTVDKSILGELFFNALKTQYLGLFYESIDF